MSSTKNFKNNLVENAKKVKGVAESFEAGLTAGEKYLEERKKKREPVEVVEELTLGQRLLQERLEGKPIIETPMIEESVPTPVVSEDVQETAQMISEITESMTSASVHNRITDPQTEEGRVVEYLEAIRINENANKQSLVEQDLQNTPATMAELANLRSVVTRLQTSLTSLGGGGIGYQEVKQMIEDGDFNIDSADLWALEAALVKYIDSAIGEAFDSANLVGGYTTDDITEGSNLYYTQSRFDSAFADKTTSDLDEGSNLYYTSARFDSDFATKSVGDAYDSATVQGQIDSAIDAIEPFDISTKTTDDVAEGSTNLYYTQGRFDSALNDKTTSDLTEGANLYYTEARVDANFATKTTDDLAEGVANKYYGTALFDVDFATKSTDSLGEGSTNLYYTDARVTALVDSAYVQERVTLEAGVHFKGVVNFATDSAPVNPEAGDMYVADSDAVANASWVGIAGDTIVAQHGVIWANADSSWHEVGSTSVDASVYVEKTGDTMTGNLTLESGDINVDEGDVTLENGNLTLEEPNAKVFTNNIENSSASEYVKIYKDANLKAAFKENEIVSYQPHTYPNNIAADISATGTDQTLIHKGYVDSEVSLRVSTRGDNMTGTLHWNKGGLESIKTINVKDGANSLFSIQASGSLNWSADPSTNPSLIYNDQKHIEFSEMSNGTPQTNFASWVHLPNTGIMFGTGYDTQLSDGALYMSGSSSKIEMTNLAYLQVHRIRPAPDKYGDGLTLESKVNLGGFANMGSYGMTVTEDEVVINATPTADNHAATKKYVDDHAGGGVTISSTGQPAGFAAGSMYYDTSTGSLILKVS